MQREALALGLREDHLPLNAVSVLWFTLNPEWKSYIDCYCACGHTTALQLIYVDYTRPTGTFKAPFSILIFNSCIYLFQAILHFVNQNMSSIGLQVADMDKQVTEKEHV